MAFRRVSEIKPWLVDFLLSDSDTPRMTGEKLHVLKYVSGPHKDGSIVKAATDLDVFINVRFTAHALAVFTSTVDSESPDTHEEFNRALIILRKYWSAHYPQSNKDTSHFEVVIDDFSLWMNETGLRLKVEPLPCMYVAEVRTKSNRLWAEWKSQQSSWRDSSTDDEEDETGTSENGGEPSMSSIPLSQLLDQMGVSSSTAADQEKENVRGGVFTGKQRLSLLGPSDLPVQLPKDVDTSLIHISEDQQNQLNNIPEWKSGYHPPAVSYVSSCPSTENSASKSSPARQSSQTENSLSRPPLPDRPWRRAAAENSFRVLGTLTTVEPFEDRVTTSDMGIGTYGIDVAIQVGDSMLGKSSTGITHLTEIAAQVGDSLLNPRVCDSQSQYVSESQCDFQSQCAFDDVTKVSCNSDDADSLSKSSFDSVIELDYPCNMTQSQAIEINQLDERSCNNQITDTQGQRLVSSREESSGTSNSIGNESKKSNSRTSRKDISRDTNTDDDSFVTEDSLDKYGLAADVGDYIPRVRLSCSESPETVQAVRKSLRRSASSSSMEKQQNRREPKSIDHNADKSVKLGQVQRLRSVDFSDGDHRRSPRLQLAAPELGQVQLLRSVDSSDGEHRRSPQLQQLAAPRKELKSIDDNSDNSMRFDRVQRLRSDNSSDGDQRRSPRLQQAAAPGKESPVGRSRNVAELRDVPMQRSSPQNRQGTEENFAESEDIIMPTPPKVSRRKGYSPLRPISTRSNQKKNASPLVDLKGTHSLLQTPVTFQGEVTVHRIHDDTSRNLDKQLQVVDTSASAKAAASPGRGSRRGTELPILKNQEVTAETPSTGEEISPARPDHISPRIPSDAIAVTEETEVVKTPVHAAIISPSPRSTRRSITQGPYHSTQTSPETTRELPPLKLTLSPIKTQDRCGIDIRRKRETLGRKDARKSASRLAADASIGTDSTSSEGLGTEESRRPSRKSETIDNEKTTIVYFLPKTTDSPKRRNRSIEHRSPAPPEKSSLNYQAPKNTVKMLPCVAVERLELSKYKTSSSGSVIINDADPVIQMEAPPEESQAITPGSNEGIRCNIRLQEPVNDIFEDSAKRGTRRTASDKTKEIEAIKVPTKSPHLSVTTGRVVVRPCRSEPRVPVNIDDRNKSPHLSVIHGHKIARPPRSTTQENSSVCVSRKERPNMTLQSPPLTKEFKYSTSSSDSSSPSSEEDARTPARVQTTPSPRAPHTPQAAEQQRHTRNSSSSSSVSVDQFYGGSENSPRWRSPRVHICMSIQTEDEHGKDKSDTPTGKSPASKTPKSSKHKTQSEKPVSYTRQGKFNVTRKTPRQSQVPEYSCSPTSCKDQQSDAPIAKTSTRASRTTEKGLVVEDTRHTCSESVTASKHRKVGPIHIVKIPYEQSDDESSIIEIDDSAKTQSDDDDYEPQSSHRLQKSLTQSDTPNHQSERDDRLQKRTPLRTPRKHKTQQSEEGRPTLCVLVQRIPEPHRQMRLKPSDETSMEETTGNDDAKTSNDENCISGSSGNKSKLENKTPVSNRGKLRNSESKKSTKTQKMEETEEDEKTSGDDFRPSPCKKIKAQTRQRTIVRQKRQKTLKESSDEASEDDKDEDYYPSDHEEDEDYNPSPGTKLHLPFDRKSTRRYQDRTKLSLAKKPAAQPRKTKPKNRMNVQLADTGRIEIIQEKTVPHNLSALFSASKKPANAKLKPSITRKRKLFSEQTLLGEPLPEVQEKAEKPAKGCNLRLKMASPLKPLLPKLSGKRQVYDVSNDSDIAAQASDKLSLSIGNDESTPHKNSEEQEMGTTENSLPLDNVAEEEGEAMMTTPISSLPSHQPVTRDSSSEESLDVSDQQQKEGIATAPDQDATTAAEDQGNLEDLESNLLAPVKASTTSGESGYSVSTPTSSLPSHQPEQREEPAPLKDTPLWEDIQMILSILPKDASTPLTDMDMPPDLITKLSDYFGNDEFA